jgi:hypothetical protein
MQFVQLGESKYLRLLTIFYHLHILNVVAFVSLHNYMLTTRRLEKLSKKSAAYKKTNIEFTLPQVYKPANTVVGYVTRNCQSAPNKAINRCRRNRASTVVYPVVLFGLLAFSAVDSASSCSVGRS